MFIISLDLYKEIAIFVKDFQKRIVDEDTECTISEVGITARIN